MAGTRLLGGTISGLVKVQDAERPALPESPYPLPFAPDPLRSMLDRLPVPTRPLRVGYRHFVHVHVDRATPRPRAQLPLALTRALQTLKATSP